MPLQPINFTQGPGCATVSPFLSTAVDFQWLHRKEIASVLSHDLASGGGGTEFLPFPLSRSTKADRYKRYDLGFRCIRGTVKPAEQAYLPQRELQIVDVGVVRISRPISVHLEVGTVAV
jgi:hypothetical protein